jgi:aspartyl-tRNA(Asn)/glutamyl-tRNA(Gln) amidotransferase subunit C
MMAVSADEVRRIAALARLSLDEAQLPAMAEELTGILRHMDVLRNAPREAGAVNSVSITPSVWRSDTIEPSDHAIAMERVAPMMREGFFLVPRLATHEGPDGAPEPSVPS